MSARDKRFVLRPFEQGDEIALVRHINSSRIAERVSNIPHPYTEKHAQDWLLRLAEERDKFHYARRMDFAITVSDEVVGSIAFINIDGHKAQISYWLGEEFQGRGIMPEVLRLVAEFGFTVCGFKRIWGQIQLLSVCLKKRVSPERAYIVKSGTRTAPIMTRSCMRSYNKKHTRKKKNAAPMGAAMFFYRDGISCSESLLTLPPEVSDSMIALASMLSQGIIVRKSA